METQLAAVGGRRGGELPDDLDDRGQLLVVRTDAGVQLGELGGKGLVVDEDLPQADEGADHLDAHLDRCLAVEDVGSLDGPVLSEGEGKKSRVAVLL